MERKQGTWNPDSTAIERECKLRQIGKELDRLKASGQVSTTDPRHLSEKDVLAFARHIRSWDPGVQKAMLSLMKGYLGFFKNHAIEDLIESGELHIPRPAVKPVRYIEQDDLAEIFRTVDAMRGWTGTCARGLTALYFGTGVRPSELRLAELRDLDMRKEELYVRHPKGLGNWASPVWVKIIRGDVLPMVDRYLDERAEAFNGRKLAPLFPVMNGRTRGGFYSDSRFCDIAAAISKESGVEFTFKDLRSTLCTMTVNGDVTRLPLMTVQLRHSGPDVTKKFYWNIDRSAAGKQLSEMWRETAIVPGQSGAVLKEQKPPLIDSKFEVSGYA